MGTNAAKEPEVIVRANRIIVILDKFIGEGNLYSQKVKTIRDEFLSIADACASSKTATCTVEVTKVVLHLIGSRTTKDITLSNDTLKELFMIYERKLNEACAVAEKVYAKLSA